jgi:hypothetical protein
MGVVGFQLQRASGDAGCSLQIILNSVGGTARLVIWARNTRPSYITLFVRRCVLGFEHEERHRKPGQFQQVTILESRHLDGLGLVILIENISLGQF